ncbi:MAG: hypothetical protein QXO47_10440 [Thermoproteota archaeon]
MVKIRTLPNFRIHYLSYFDQYITPNVLNGASGNFITGALTATTVSDPVVLVEPRELALNFTVQSVSGTSPTLDIYLDILDPVQPQNKNVTSTENPPLLSLKLDPTQITGAQTLRVVIAYGTATAWEGGTATVLGNLNVPVRFQVRFVIGGTSPSFGVIATFEARE